MQRVDLHPDHLKVVIQLDGPQPLRLEKRVAMRLKRKGCERRIVIEGHPAPCQVDPLLMNATSRGLRFWENLNSDQPVTALAFVRAEGVDNRYLGRALRLAFLAPDVVEAIANGRTPAEWTADKLMHWEPLPLSWPKQREALDLI